MADDQPAPDARSTDAAAPDAHALYGAVPNLFAAMAPHTDMPAAMHVAVDAMLAEGCLSSVEQQVVLLEMARYHGSRYDAVVHARLAFDAGLSTRAVERILAGAGAEDERYGPLVQATRQACEARGWMAPEALADLERRGVTRGKLYEVFALIGMKTFTSFTCHLADVEVDEELKPTEAQLDHVPEKPEPTAVARQRFFVG
jgi:alkylhydroperoxidase family enzyme